MSKKTKLDRLPEGWVYTQLGDIISLDYGKNLTKANRQVGRYPVFGSNGIIGHHREYLVLAPVIIIGRKGAVGTVHISIENCWPIDTTYYIEPLKSVNFKFLYYLLKSLNLAKLDTSTTIPGINRNSIYKQRIALPPLTEQVRIGLKLDELLSELEKNKELLDTANKQLNIYKQAILKDAFDGQLTKEWRLSRSNKNSHNSSGLPNGWMYVKLYEIVESNSKKVYPNANQHLKFIGLDSIEPGNLHLSSIHNFSQFKSAANYFEKDQVLYGRMRPYLNKVWKADFEGACSGEFIILKCKPTLLADFLKYKLHSVDYVSFATKKAAGDRPRISYEEMSNYMFPLCSIEEQTEVIKIIEHHLTNADNIRKGILESLKQIDLLEKTLIQNAFNGTLTYRSQDGESADLLLERIKIERELFVFGEKERSKDKTRTIMSDELKPLIEILKERNEPVSAKELWLLSTNKESIDAFYAELKTYVEAGEVIEIARSGKESFLQLANNQ